MLEFQVFEEMITFLKNCFDPNDGISCWASAKNHSVAIIFVIIFIVIFIIFPFCCFLWKCHQKRIDAKLKNQIDKSKDIIERCLEVIIDLYQVAIFCEFDLSESTRVSSKSWVKKSRKSKWIKETSYRSDKNPFDSIKKDAENIKNAEVSKLIDQGLQINNSLVSFRQELEADDTEINYGHARKAGFIRNKAKSLLSEYKKNLTEGQKSRIKSIQDAEFSPSIPKWNRWFCKKYKPSEELYEPDTQVQYPDNDLDDDK